MPDNEKDARAVQRANILEGAQKAFARKGRAATMADVAAAAGVSQGLAYRYFSGKAEIYRALLEQAMEQAQQSMDLPQNSGTATPGQQLTAFIAQLVNHRRDHLADFQLLDQVLNADEIPPDVSDLIRQRRERFFEDFRRLIVAGQTTGEVALDDPDQLILAFTAALEGLTRFGLQQPEQFKQRFPDVGILLRIFEP